MGEESVVTEVPIEKSEKELRELLQKEYDTRLENQVTEITEKIKTENEKAVAAAIENFRKEMAPPGEQDVQKLLEQEYVTFTIEVSERGKTEPRKFTIVELPQKIEKKIYKKIKETLVPFSSDLAAISMNLLEGDAAKKIIQLMNAFDPLLDVMTGIATISLNPFGDEEDVTEEWVSKNLSSTRILKIVTAQIECNRMRDFFSLLFRGSKMMK